MPGLDPGIHGSRSDAKSLGADDRVKPGHDEQEGVVIL
jgi:hypothetical protein